MTFREWPSSSPVGIPELYIYRSSFISGSSVPSNVSCVPCHNCGEDPDSGLVGSCCPVLATKNLNGSWNSDLIQDLAELGKTKSCQLPSSASQGSYSPFSPQASSLHLHPLFIHRRREVQYASCLHVGCEVFMHQLSMA